MDELLELFPQSGGSECDENWDSDEMYFEEEKEETEKEFL